MAPRRSKRPKHHPLSANEVRWACDPGSFDFETTETLGSPEPFLGQKRALRALQFGAQAHNPGFNVFVVGQHGTGRTSMSRQFLERLAATRRTPPDYCYVHDFDNGGEAHALRLPPGTGRKLRDGMLAVVKELRQSLPRAFEEEDYERDRMAIRMTIEQRQAEVFENLRQAAEDKGFAIARTQQGFAVAPVREGVVLEPAQLAELDDEEQDELKVAEKAVRDLLRQTLRQFRDIEKSSIRDLEDLERESADSVVAHAISDLMEATGDLEDVQAYLEAVKGDILGNLDEFKADDEEAEAGMMSPGHMEVPFPFIDRYKVNLLVDNSANAGAPVIQEDFPTYRNLLGRINHEAHFGNMVTHFSMIRPGSLHLANGGFLVIDAEDLLRNPQAWDGLKRALRVKHLKLEEPFEQLKIQATVDIEPDPIPLDVKVVLIGTPLIFHLLHNNDSDFPELFKVTAEFRPSMGRSDRSIEAFAGFCAARCEELELLPLEANAVARLCEHSARSAGQQDRLDLRFRDLIDLIHESDFWARQTCYDKGLPAPCAIHADHVDIAVNQRSDRGRNLQETVVRLIGEGTIRIDLDDPVVGQINGLTVLQVGQTPFGAPARLSARITAGQGYVVNVEREVQLSGPFHNKGVLILTGYIKGKYGRHYPLSVNASVVFEQSYSPVDGDSATLAEICAIVSAAAELPLRQDVAVTGSVDQMGQVQAVGGVNEKIEGFWTAIQALQPGRTAGVILPRTNVRHLMLDQELVEAVRLGQLSIWPVDTVDQALEILTGMPAVQIDVLVEDHLETLRDNVKGGPPGAESMVILSQADGIPTGPPDPTPKR
ncbi:MAG: AAA family ATPase [Myxococcota bacterium]|nr:AAA family ATPase [Myxococcota bacterium]